MRHGANKNFTVRLVLASLFGFTLGGFSYGADYTGQLTGNFEKDKAIVGGNAALAGNVITYDFKEDTTLTAHFNWEDMAKTPYKITTGLQGYMGTIQPGGMRSDVYKPKGPFSDMVFNLNGHDLTVYNYTDTGIGKINPSIPGQGAYAATTDIFVDTPNKIEFNNPGKLRFVDSATGYYISGLYAGYYRGLGSEEKELADRRPGIYIHNQPGWDNAVKIESGGAQYAENITGIKIFNRGELIIDGYADFSKETTDPRTGKKTTKYWGLDVNTMGTGWKQYSAHFKVGGGRWGRIYVYGKSLLELNTEMDGQGHVKALHNDVQMVGNVDSNGTWSRDPTTINMALTTPSSFWQGSGNMENLFLTNGAYWDSGTGGGTISHFHGAGAGEKVGEIRFSAVRGTAKPITFNEYEGNTVVLYSHKDDAPQTVLGSHVTIGKALPSSSITMQTDHKGIDFSDAGQVDGVLDALANTLTYTNYITGERNLTAKVKIAEGLTAASAEKAVGDIQFSANKGEGYYLQQLKHEFTTTLTGDMKSDAEYVDARVLLSDNTFKTGENASITVDNRAAVAPRDGMQLDVSAVGSDLSLKSVFSDGGATLDLKGTTSEARQLNLTAKNLLITTEGKGDLVGLSVSRSKNNGIKTMGGLNFKGVLTGDGVYTAVRISDGAIYTLTNKAGTDKPQFDVEQAGRANFLEASNKGILHYTGGSLSLPSGGYLARSLNGGLVNLHVSGENRGDMYTERGSDGNGMINMYLEKSGSVWHGSFDGNGTVTLQISPTFITSGKTSKNIWYNEWQTKETKDRDVSISAFNFNNTLPGEGWIYQKNTGKLSFGEIKTPSTSIKDPRYGLYVLFDHDEKEPATILGGDVVIDHVTQPAKGSATVDVSLRTPSVGIDVSDHRHVNRVLENLAKKLVYTAYAKGERYLSGTVGLEEGLLTESATSTLFGKKIEFDETGRGVYTPQKGNRFTNPITGEEDWSYIDALVKQGDVYLFNDASDIAVQAEKSGVAAAIWLKNNKNITVDGEMGDLALSVDASGQTEGMVAGIIVEKGNLLSIRPGSLSINVKSGVPEAYGMYVTGDKEKSEIQQALEYGRANQGAADLKKVLTIRGEMGKGGNFTAVKSDNMAEVYLKGRLDIVGEGDTAFLANHGAVITGILTGGDGWLSSVNMTGGVLARAGNGGSISLSFSPYGDGKISGTKIIGDIYDDIDGKTGSILFNLGNAASWKGSVDGKEKVTIRAEGKLALDGGNRSIWTNEWQTGSGESRVNVLEGGNSNSAGNEGIVYQKNPDKLTVDQLKGNIGFFYDHDKEDPSKILGGDIYIQESMTKGQGTSSSIYVRTWLDGVDYGNETARNQVYDALAKKMYYFGDANKVKGKVGLRGDMNIGLIRPTGSKVPNAEKMQDYVFNFNAKTGQGYYYYASPEQVSSEFRQTLTGHNKISEANTDTNMKDYLYAQGGVIDESGHYIFKTVGDAVANRIVVGDQDTASLGEKAAVIGIAAQDMDITASADNTLDITAASSRAGQDAMGIYTGKGHVLSLQSHDLILTPSATLGEGQEGVRGTAYGIYNEGTFTLDGNVRVTGGDMAVLAKKGAVTLGGGFTSDARTAIEADTGASVRVGTLTAHSAENVPALYANGGDIVINEDKQGTVTLMGDIAIDAGSVVLHMNKSGDAWSGSLKNVAGNMSLSLANGAVWNNNYQGRQDGSMINELTGGSTKETAGVIFQQTDSDMTVENYSGHVRFLYGHDETNPINVYGGNLSIRNAAENSAVHLVTDTAGLNTSDESVKPVLESLANKVTYLGYQDAPNHLTGTLEIAEGLLSQSAGVKISDLAFDKDGKGHLSGNVHDVDSDTGDVAVHTADIVYGPKQTAMMRGAKSAMASSALLWRATINDVQKRLGDLRGAEGVETGVWARVGGGKLSYRDDSTDFSTTFTDYYVGYDKEIGKGDWRIGAALNYIDGDSAYEYGKGDNTVATLNFYATRMQEDGVYTDIILKGGKIRSEYTVANDYGKQLKGDYDTTGYSLSAEYGKRIERDNGFYWEPQAELTWGRLNGKTYNAYSDYYGGTAMTVNQKAFDSLIGRIGIGIGKTSGRGHFYGKVSLLHEFLGDFETGYSAPGEQSKKTSLDFGGTWINVAIGGQYAMSDRVYLYGNIEKSFGGDVELDWRANVGVRFAF